MTASSKRRAKRSHTPEWDPDRRVPFQSGSENQGLYGIMLDTLLQVAQSRFAWHNTPAGVNPWYLERTLLYTGCATIMHIKGMPGRFYGTQAAQTGRWDIYDYPIAWRSIGNNGWNHACDKTNAVLIYDNPNRYPVINKLMWFARELESIMTTKQINRLNMRTPFLITAPQGREFDALQVLKDMVGGEMAVLGLDSITDVQVQAIQTGVEWLGDKLMTDFQDTLKQAFAMLGVESARVKSERMVSEEVTADTASTAMIRQGSLDMRNMACKAFNQKFGTDMYVTWAQDNLTKLHNMMVLPPGADDGNADGEGV